MGTVIVLGAAALASTPVMSSAAEQATNGLVSYGPPTYVQSLSKEAEDVQVLARRAAELADANKDLFLGSFVSTDGRVVIVPATEDGQALAARDLRGQKADVDSPVGVSINSAQDLGSELRAQSPELAKTVFMWGADPKRRGIFLSVTTEPSPDAKAVIEEFATKGDLRITVEIDQGAQPGQLDDSRPTDPSPYAGGARYAIANGSGSGASWTLCVAQASAIYATARSTCSPRGTAIPRTMATSTSCGS